MALYAITTYLIAAVREMDLVYFELLNIETVGTYELNHKDNYLITSTHKVCLFIPTKI